VLPANVADLETLGFDVIPVTPDAKYPPVCGGWQYKAPAVQWATAPVDANAALRGGGDLQALYIDADDKKAPGTAANVRRILNGWGVYDDGDVPIVRTASLVGRQFYTRSAVRLDGSVRSLRRDIGAGEVRYGPGAYVLAPGAVVDGVIYTLEAGDLRQLPALDLADVRVFAEVDPATAQKRASIPRLAHKLLTGDAATLARYPTRSEAEQACIASLIGAGHDFDSIYALFTMHPGAGKFAELRLHSERDARRWLRRSYDNASRWSAMHESPGRALGRAAQTWALSQPWPGRTGNSMMALFLAYGEIQRQCGALTFAAPVRRLAELAGINKKTVLKVNRQLLDAGLVERVCSHTGTYSGLFRLGDAQSYDTSTDSGDGQKSYTSTHPVCVEVYDFCHADAWRFRGLGKSALLVLSQLRAAPGATAAELAESTGKHKRTVTRALARMAHIVDADTGEVLRLVEADGDGWRACTDVDLDAVARAVGTAGTGERQKAQHAEERRGFRRAVAAARAAATPEQNMTPGEHKDVRRAHELLDLVRDVEPPRPVMVPAATEAPSTTGVLFAMTAGHDVHDC